MSSKSSNGHQRNFTACDGLNGLRCKNMCISIYLFKSSGSHLREYDLIRLSVANTTNKNERGCTTIHTTNRWINTMHISHKSSGVVSLSLVFH